jgi:hypothetical protein
MARSISALIAAPARTRVERLGLLDRREVMGDEHVVGIAGRAVNLLAGAAVLHPDRVGHS